MSSDKTLLPKSYGRNAVVSYGNLWREDGGGHEQTAVKRKEQVQQRIKEENGAAAAAAIIHYKLNTLDNNEIVFQGTSLQAPRSHRCYHLLPVHPCACVPQSGHTRYQDEQTKQEGELSNQRQLSNQISECRRSFVVGMAIDCSGEVL